MQNVPVMLAPPPRRVPLSLTIANVFNMFAQIGWFVFGFGMVFGWAFVGQADFSSITFRGEHPVARGRVTSVKETGASVNHSAVVANHYEYSVAGTRYNGTSYSTGGRKSEGETVNVEYDEGNPKRSRIEGLRRAQFGPGVAFVGIFPAVGFLILYFATRSGLRRNELLRDGLLASGTLVGREGTNMRVNGRPVWKLVFEFTARDGQRHEASANTTDPARLEDEGQEPLLYDPNNPSKAYLFDELPSRPEFEPNGDLRGRGFPIGYLILPTLVVAGNLWALAFKMGWL